MKYVKYLGILHIEYENEIKTSCHKLCIHPTTYNMILDSPDFIDNGALPLSSVCPQHGGVNRMPQFRWSPVSGAKSYAFWCYDRDAPGGHCVHCFFPFISASRTGLPQIKNINHPYIQFNDDAKTAPNNTNSRGELLIQGMNSYGEYGYRGPCPGYSLSKKVHHYCFQVYALDTILEEPNLNLFLVKSKGHVLGKANMTGTFLKP